MQQLPNGWTLAASSFNWTPEVIRAERPAPEIVAAIAGDGVATVIELEAGQALRSFPEPTAEEVDALRSAVEEAGAGSASSARASTTSDRTAARAPRTSAVTSSCPSCTPPGGSGRPASACRSARRGRRCCADSSRSCTSWS
ncbi:hypothetical protein [Naasia aerilata]|uniref:Uncharacterized protein n=1 Tax=Naasia aerilata TaxID=1162966 RepID=A0ABN6XM47_9MICO|nr:hypothetical protein [Naasia aerilata]BDZ44453.1 hypothetical protein GCM10025866_03620 [Naasia aerilata]